MIKVIKMGPYLRERFGQVVVAGGAVFPPPRYVPSLVSRLRFSISPAHRFSSSLSN